MTTNKIGWVALHEVSAQETEELIEGKPIWIKYNAVCWDGRIRRYKLIGQYSGGKFYKGFDSGGEEYTSFTKKEEVDAFYLPTLTLLD